MRVREITEALRMRMRRVRPDRIALWSLVVAVLASLAAVVQAIVLAGQVWTPYRTALYVRQLEVASDYYGAAHEQWAAVIDLNLQCLRPENIDGDTAGFTVLNARFREGSTRLHDAFAGTIASFPDILHADAAHIWRENEYLVENVVMLSGNCHDFVRRYEELDIRERADAMHTSALTLVDDMRVLLRVDRWSRTDLAAERTRREVLRQRRKVRPSADGSE
jgi:hypothetical protein